MEIISTEIRSISKTCQKKQPFDMIHNTCYNLRSVRKEFTSLASVAGPMNTTYRESMHIATERHVVSESIWGLTTSAGLS
jgi:hypothetical protein